jgi:hypothetical protein
LLLKTPPFQGDVPDELPGSAGAWLLKAPAFGGDVGIEELLPQLWPWMVLAAQVVRPRDPAGEGWPLDMGVYTPTVTNVANLDATTAYQCLYLRVGSVVLVAGLVDADPTAAATLTRVGISLPFASNFGALEDLAGTAHAADIAGQGAAVRANTTTKIANMIWLSGDVTNRTMYFLFMYRILP